MEAIIKRLVSTPTTVAILGEDPIAGESLGLLLERVGYSARFLAERGAKLDIKDQRGFTPLDVAMGLAGGVGFDGRASNPHDTTAALLRELIGRTAAR